ncbi:MAG: D-glycero-beta-D-manno-heptose 1,7-bisphosphate 7-phosphatase [Deltaproteobacteria bacterium]|nr:D-glycero-beta-D-manno-heptose 1,7-bisphosphate 7-phosphatase [Deltaproteobacteria bacterium]
MKPPYPLVVLDRDGVINHDSPNYIRSPSDFVPIEGSLEAIATLNRRGVRVAVATNQSAIGRGYIDVATLEAIHLKLTDLLAAAGGKIDSIAYCPHTPDDRCTCRKPEPGLLITLAKEFQVDCQQIVFIGDSATDMEAAARAGATGILVRTGNGREHEEANRIPERVARFENLREAIESVLGEPNESEKPRKPSGQL